MEKVQDRAISRLMKLGPVHRSFLRTIEMPSSSGVSDQQSVGLIPVGGTCVLQEDT